jgi:hypothetical protein
MKYKVNIYTSNHVIEHVFTEENYKFFIKGFNNDKYIGYKDVNLGIPYNKVEGYKLVDTYED